MTASLSKSPPSSPPPPLSPLCSKQGLSCALYPPHHSNIEFFVLHTNQSNVKGTATIWEKESERERECARACVLVLIKLTLSHYWDSSPICDQKPGPQGKSLKFRVKTWFLVRFRVRVINCQVQHWGLACSSYVWVCLGPGNDSMQCPALGDCSELLGDNDSRTIQ